MKELVIIGSGGFSTEVLLIADSLNFKVIAFIDTHEKEDVLGIPVKAQNFFDPLLHEAAIAVGSPQLRKKIVEGMPPNTTWRTLIHPSAQLGIYNKIGKGSIICGNVICTTNINLGSFTQLNLGTTIGHDVVTGDYFTTAPQVAISGKCNIGDRAYFGTNSCIIENLCICDDVIIGAGATVVKDIIDPGIYCGTPAKKLKKSNE